MKTKIVVVFVALSVLIGACKKGTTFSGAKIDQATDFIRQYILTYTYDANSGEVTNIQKNTLGDTSFSYSGNTVIQSGGENGTQLLPLISYHLNGSNYADTAQGEGYLRNYMATYTYDGNGQVTQQKTYTANTLINTDNYSNVSKNISYIQHVSYTNVITYDYYSYVGNSSNTTGPEDYGKFFLGVESGNLVATDVKIASNGDTTDIISYRYYYNGSNYVDTLAAYNRAGHLVDSMAFTYY